MSAAEPGFTRRQVLLTAGASAGAIVLSAVASRPAEARDAVSLEAGAGAMLATLAASPLSSIRSAHVDATIVRLRSRHWRHVGRLDVMPGVEALAQQGFFKRPSATRLEHLRDAAFGPRSTRDPAGAGRVRQAIAALTQASLTQSEQRVNPDTVIF